MGLGGVGRPGIGPGGWHYGHWHGGWFPGAGLVVASWLTPGWGSWWYANPYATGDTSATYDYSQPIVYQAKSETSAAQPSDAGVQAFDAARAAFASGDYQKALDLANQTLKAVPNDAAVHEFRALALFALQKYSEAAAAEYAVLSAGPGWDWTTLSSLYSSVGEYEKQLRALEAFTRQNAKSADGHFLLAYHYLTAGHADAAASQLKQVKQLLPDDKLTADLLKLATPSDEQPKPAATERPAKAVAAEQLVGTWTARGTGDSQFQLTLDKDDQFVWKYTRGKTSQEVRGVYAVDHDTLALQPESGGSMLADLSFDGGKLDFRLSGGDETAPPLKFTKAKS